MSHPTESIVVRLLTWLARGVYRYPRLFFYPHVILLVLAMTVTITSLRFSNNRNDLLGTDKAAHRSFLQFKQEFPVQDDLAAVIESEDIEKNRQFVERLGVRLEAETNLFRDVFYKGDLKMMGPKALLFVTNEVILEEMVQRLKEARPMLTNFSQTTNLNTLFRLVIREFRAAGQERSDQTDALIGAIPALGRIADQATAALERPGTPPSPGVTALFDGGEEAEKDLYITFASNRIYLVTAKAASEDLNGDAVLRLRELIEQTQREVPGVNVGITGEPVLEVDEMAQSQVDTTVATLVSLVICAFLFIYGYKETGRPVKATICLVVGLVYTLGFATVTIGSLNLLTITFLPMLIGMGVDFGIHLVARYEEELRLGMSERVAIEKAVVNTGQGIFTGCFTTAGAFLAMGFTEFKGVKEMGIISGGGLLICLFPMMTMLPVLLLRGRQNVIDHTPHVEIDHRARIERLWLDHPGFVTGFTILLTVASLWKFPQVHFDHNLLNLQTKGLPAVDCERKMIQVVGKSVIFGAVVANSVQEAVQLEQRLEKLPSVSGVDSITRYLAEDQTRKLSLIRQIKAQLAGLRFPEVDDDPVSLTELKGTLQTLQAYLSMGAKGAAQGGEGELSDELRKVRQTVARLRQTIQATDPELASRKLAQFQQALFRDLQDTLAAIRDQDDRAGLGVDDLPAPLKHRFVSHSGKRYLLQVQSNLDLWQRESQETFVREVRTVAPDVTGTPVQLLEYVTLLKDSYVQAAYYALAAIAVLVFIHFRSVVCVVLALLPVALGTTWMVGYMGWAGVPFNPANIMTLPLVIGVGVTNGIHILNRFAEEHNPSIFAKSTGKAVLLSALTTVAGFGSLAPAKHQGIASLGIVMAIGTATCMLAGMTFLPAVLGFLTRRGWRLPKHLQERFTEPVSAPSEGKD